MILNKDSKTLLDNINADFKLVLGEHLKPRVSDFFSYDNMFIREFLQQDIHDVSSKLKYTIKRENSTVYIVNLIRENYFKLSIRLMCNAERVIFQTYTFTVFGTEMYRYDVDITNDILNSDKSIFYKTKDELSIIGKLFFTSDYAQGNHGLYQLILANIHSKINHDYDTVNAFEGYLYKLFELLKPINLQLIKPIYTVGSHHLKLSIKSLDNANNILNLLIEKNGKDYIFSLRLNTNGNVQFTSQINRIEDFYMLIPTIELFIKND